MRRGFGGRRPSPEDGGETPEASPSPPDPAKLLEYAVRVLAEQARSEAEIARRLVRRGADEESVAAVLERLRGFGYLDDASLARRWVESRGASRGRRALAFELRRKGVDPAEALSERTDDDERGAARAAAVRKVGERPADVSREARAKLAAFLQRRGFGWDAIRPVLNELYAARDDDDLSADDAD